MPPVLLDARQLGQRLDASYYEVLDWARRDVVPSIKVGGRYFFDLRKVVRALNERSTAAPQEEAVPC